MAHELVLSCPANRSLSLAYSKPIVPPRPPHCDETCTELAHYVFFVNIRPEIAETGQRLTTNHNHLFLWPVDSTTIEALG
jgi:hypothetical protein